MHTRTAPQCDQKGLSRADLRYGGFCPVCGRVHSLEAAPALPYAQALMHELEANDSVFPGKGGTSSRNPFLSPPESETPESEDPARFSTGILYGPARGQMFGVLTCRDREGRDCVLRAFSCQYNGMWTVPGWVPPVFDPLAFHAQSGPVEPEIKRLTRIIAAMDRMDPARPGLVRTRRDMSRDLMRRLHGLYTLRNFRGEERSMAEVASAFAAHASRTATSTRSDGTGFSDPVRESPGLPTGMGDCCAPKLLHYAARHGLAPTGLAEFYWGLENRSGTRRQGQFYPPCTDKCGPILGFMLCGTTGSSRESEAVGKSTLPQEVRP